MTPSLRAQDIRMLPRTGQRLSALGLGCAPLGNLYTAISDDEAEATVDEAWAKGLRYFDTAPLYGHTLSEQRLGQALRKYPREGYCVSTKVGRLLEPRPAGWTEPGDGPWIDPLPFVPRFDYTAGGVRRSIEGSLNRLGVSHIDLALVHDIGAASHGASNDLYWSQLTEGGGLRALEALRIERVIGAIGLGVNECQAVQDAMDHVDLDCTLLAGRYTLLEQGALHPLLDMCVRRRVGVVIGGPFNSGILATGPSSAARFNYRSAPAEVLTRVERLQAVCRSFGVPLAAAALQFPLAHPAVTSCVPGARNRVELRAVVEWLETSIPNALWQSMVTQGLLPEGVPVPGSSNAESGSA